MALRHYAGSTPTSDGEWTCPSCHETQAGPLKAGCQQCGAGADARKAEAPQRTTLAPETLRMIADEKAEDARRVAEAQVSAACAAWLQQADYPVDQVTPWATAAHLREAFMAGVAWAQGRLAAEASAAIGGVEITDSRLLNEVPPAASAALYLAEVGEEPGPLGPTACQTILAALAFYRDHSLAYGEVPGQLSAEQVDQLIARLSPAEEG